MLRSAMKKNKKKGSTGVHEVFVLIVWYARHLDEVTLSQDLNNIKKQILQISRLTTSQRKGLETEM